MCIYIYIDNTCQPGIAASELVGNKFPLTVTSMGHSTRRPLMAACETAVACVTTRNTTTTCVPSFFCPRRKTNFRNCCQQGLRFRLSVTARNLTTIPKGKTSEETSEVFFSRG